MADSVTLGVIIIDLVGAYKAYTEYKAAVAKAAAEKKAAPAKDVEAAKGEQIAQVVESGIQKYGRPEEQTALAGYQQSPQLFDPVLSKVLSDIAAREPAFAGQLQMLAQQANIQTDTAARPAGDAIAGDKVGGDKVGGDKIVEPHGTVDVSAPARIQGTAVGVNTGTIQAFFGTSPPADAKELLDNYLESLVAEYGRLRLGKLLGKEQTGREQAVVPTLSLRAVYTALATNARIPMGEFANQHPKAIFKVMDAGDPAKVLPDQVRLAVLRAADERVASAVGQVPGVVLSDQTLAAQWAALRHAPESAPDRALSGQWYRPEMTVDAVSEHRRLVLLGSPGSGKSTMLRHLVVQLAEALLDERDPSKSPLPIPFFCQLGPVAQQLGVDPAHDLGILIDALVAPVVGAADMRAGLRDTIFRAWGRGGALLCLDGLDEVSGIAAVPGAPSLRQRMADAIRHLAKQIGRSQIVVTCRTRPYKQDAAWQLRDDWTVRALEPFSFGQVRRFVPAWYAQASAAEQAKYTPAEAQRRAAQLVEELARRSALQELTASPLLLTMLTLLHYNNQKHLPDDRADVYEELVALLLDRWEGVRSADADRRLQSIGERLGLPQVAAADLRPAIHEIAFDAHGQAVDGRGVLSGEVMRRSLDAFFAHKLNPIDPHAVSRAAYVERSDQLIALLREETGLIQEEGDDAYVLPHLTFEEYLAACHLAGREDVALAYAQWRDGGERWREPLLLLMGRLRRQEKYALAYAWLDLLAATRDGSAPKLAAQRQRDALLAVGCYDALGGRATFAGRAHDLIGFEERLGLALVELLERPASEILLLQRVEAGEALGRLGDPRLLDPKTGKAISGEYWCEVKSGKFWYGDDRPCTGDRLIDRESRYDFRIARYPVTHAEYKQFIDDDNGYLPPYTWWTEQGKEYLRRHPIKQPLYWNDSRHNNPSQPVVGISWYEAMAYCRWLTNQGHRSGWLPEDHLIRLPTSLEWEHAARGNDDTRPYPWGAFKCRVFERRTAPVKALRGRANLLVR